MSYIPATVNLTGTDTIQEGATYARTFTIKDSTGTAINLTSAGFTIVRCEFRTDNVQDGGVTTGCPQPRMRFSDPTNGIVQMIFDPDTWATDAASPYPISVFAGEYHIELEDTSYSGYGSPALRRVERVVEGNWTVSKEVTQDS